MPDSNSKTQGRLCDGLGSNIVVFCWSHYYTSWPHYCKGVRRKVGYSGTSHDPDVISEQRRSFPRRQLELFSHGLKSTEVYFNIIPWPAQSIYLTSLNHSGRFWRLQWRKDSHL
jgi:hypothetical protein